MIIEYNPEVVFNEIRMSPIYNQLITEKSDFVGEIITKNKPSALFLKLMNIIEEHREKVQQDLEMFKDYDFSNLFGLDCSFPLTIVNIPMWMKGKEKCQKEVYDKYHNTMERGSIVDKCLAENKLKIDLKMIDLYFKDHER